jgi:hypothetical protein
MALEKHITTRELLRSFKKYKEMLLSGEIMHVVISVGNGEELEVKKHTKGLSGSEFVRRVQALKKPIHMERPEGIFDDFMERIEKRRAESFEPVNND